LFVIVSIDFIFILIYKMKKIALLWLFLSCFFFAWCGQKLWEWEGIYEWELIFAWKWPEITFESTVDEGTVVMKWYFEDHSDHIFLDYNILFEKYPMKMPELFYTPWNVVKFKWVVKALDSAAGNHYYQVKSIDKLELVRYPNIDEINEIFDSYNYCESDSDCEYIVWKCPFGCYIPVNKSFINVSNLIINNYYMNNQEEKCVYGCVAMDKVFCENYKCVMKSNEESWENKELIACTPEQKSADICTMQYEPVCWSDSRTYWNSCVACQSETVETYTQWECESSAFVIEWDSEYLSYAMDILNNEWIVSCDMFYSDFWKEEVHAMFVADKDRFYSAIDDYSDSTNRNVFYRLAKDGKVYDWSTFPDSETNVTDYPADIESEIASIIFDLWKKSDLKIDCHNWIDDEHLFESTSH